MYVVQFYSLGTRNEGFNLLIELVESRQTNVGRCEVFTLQLISQDKFNLTFFVHALRGLYTNNSRYAKTVSFLIQNDSRNPLSKLRTGETGIYGNGKLLLISETSARICASAASSSRFSSAR